MYSTQKQFNVAVVGGGCGGLAVASRIRRMKPSLSIAIFEPKTVHYYQPGWTLVGGGIFPDKEITKRSEADYIPHDVTWINQAVSAFKPEDNIVITEQGEEYKYDVMIVAAGLQCNWNEIKGLKEAIGKDGVCSNYSYDYVDSTWKFIQEFKGGRAVFTQPSTPIKCGGAPQKIMYLAEDYWSKKGIRERCNVEFYTGTPTIFVSPTYATTLMEICKQRNLKVNFQCDLVEINSEKKEAIFKKGEELIHVPYDMIHVTPPMSSPDFIKRSPLANEAGWVSVDKETTQHVKYPSIFALGDCSSLPTSKTAAAITKQAPITSKNVIAFLEGKSLHGKYDGYTSCPLVTGREQGEIKYVLVEQTCSPQYVLEYASKGLLEILRDKTVHETLSSS